MQLMVLGMHRSGTSVLARILNIMGVYFAPEGVGTGANQENPMGFWERRDVRDLNDMLLQSTGCDWNRVSGFDIAAIPEQVLADFNKRAARLVLDMDANRPWFLKEPRLCLLLPLWRQFLEVPVCIHIVRHPVEVAASLQTRNKIPIEIGLVLWDRYVRDALDASTDLPRLIVSHRQMMEDPKAAVSELLSGLQEAGVSSLRAPTDREIRSFIRDDLYREREGRPDLKKYAKARQISLFESLVSGRLPKQRTLKPASVFGKKELAKYEATLPPLPTPKPIRPAMPEPERVLREQLAVKAREVELVREMLETGAAELSAKEERLAALAKEISSMRGTLDKLAAELGESRADSAGLHRHVETLTAELKVAGDLHAALSEELRESKAENAGLRSDVGEATANLKAAGDAHTALSGELRESKAENFELRGSVEEAAAKLEAVEDALINAERGASDRSREIETLSRLLMNQEEATRSAESRAHGLNARLVKSTAELARTAENLARAVASGEAEKIRFDKDVQARINALVKANAEIDRLNREREKLRREVGRLALVSASRKQVVDDLSQRMLAMSNSLAWRVGAPLRGVRRILVGRFTKAAALDDDLQVIRNSGLFDVEWYLKQNPDVSEVGVDPIEHYVRYGAHEGRNPGPDFDTGYYLSRNPDVADGGLNPLVHYIRHGKEEGRGTRQQGRSDG